MKNKLIILSLVVLLGFVSAFSIGQILTQDQLDNINVNNLDLGEGFVRDDNNKVIYDCEWRGSVKICWVELNYSTINPIYDEFGNFTGNYSSVYETKKLLFRAKHYVDLKNDHNLTYAKQQLKKSLKTRRDETYADNLKKISDYQTQPTYDITDLMTDLDI